jgi:predicted nucleic acid-binding protein
MGALTIPPDGLVYIDTNIVIYAVEKVEPYKSLLDPVWSAARAGQILVGTSELTWLEALAKPIRDSNAALESHFRAFLTAKEVTLIQATLGMWEQAARLRSLGLKTPDALHAATALSAACTAFLTNDAVFNRVPGLPVIVLSAATM